jgi:hypothetical protein
VEQRLGGLGRGASALVGCAMIKRLRAGLGAAADSSGGRGAGVGLVSISEQREQAKIIMDKSQRDPEVLLKDGGRWLDELVELGSDDDVTTVRHVVRTLANLAGHERMHVNLVQAGLLRTLVLAAQHPDQRVCLTASEALNLLGVYGHQSLDHLVQVTGVETLRYLCQCNDLTAQRAAAAVLAGMVMQEGHAMDEDDFRSVMHLACSTDEQIQISAGLAVQCAIDYLSANPEVVTKIVGEGSIIPGLVKVVLDGGSTAPLRLLASSVITAAITQESFGCRGCSQEPITEPCCWKIPPDEIESLELEQTPARAKGIARVQRQSLGKAASIRPTLSLDLPKVTGPKGEPMPPGWVTRRSRSQGRYYYVHKASGRSTWEFPMPEGPASQAPRIGPDDGTPATTRLPTEDSGDAALPVAAAADQQAPEQQDREQSSSPVKSIEVPLPRTAESVDTPSPVRSASEDTPSGEAVQAPPIMGAGLGLELIEPEPEPEPEETPPRPSRPLLQRQNTPLSASPRTRSQRRMSARYTQLERRSPFLCMNCTHGLDERRRGRLEEIQVQESLRPTVLRDGGHRALLALAQAWWHDETDYNESGQLVAEAKELQEVSLFGLASLATSAATACELVAEGALTILVGLLDPVGPPPRPELRVLRSAARALANIACSARHGTWQGDAIGSAIFGTDALEPLLQLCHHSDVQVVRHVSRALAELAFISVRPGLANVGDSQAAFTPNSNRSSMMMPTTAGGYGMSARSGLGSVSMSMFAPLSKPMSLWSRSSRKMIAGPSSAQSASRLQDKRALPNICQETEEIGWLLKLATHDDVVIRRAAAKVFYRLGRKASGWLLRAEQDSSGEVMDVLMELGAYDDQQIRCHVMLALEAITMNGYFVPVVTSHPEFGRVALTARNPDEVRSSASILKNLSQAEIGEVDQGVVMDMISAALQVLKTDNDKAIVEISFFIARLCGHQLSAVIADVERLRDVCLALLQMCTAAHLQAHLSNRGDELQMTNATEALAHIASDATGCRILMDLKATKTLVSVLKATKSEACRMHATAAMAILIGGDGEGIDPSDMRASADPDAARRLSAAPEAVPDRANIPANLIVDESQVELMGRISSGQFGDVFKGSWAGTDVAVKRMKCGAHAEKEKIIQDFENEVELISTVRHPNICMVMGAIGEWPRLCIITELCHRGSLYHILQAKDKMKLPWYRRIALAKDAAAGVAVLHNHDPCIVHLDLKSPNLLVDRHWVCKVCDFGLGQTKKGFYVSEGCGGVGTPEWTAPEVLKGEAFSEKADVYSFGVIMWGASVHPSVLTSFTFGWLLSNSNSQRMPTPSLSS